MPRLRFAMVCASNQNRSMETHALLKKNNFNVRSYGTGSSVKLPGPSAAEPNVFEFGTRYDAMAAQLSAADAGLYTRNGILRMLERNSGVKPAPERWQALRSLSLDVVVCFEERVAEAVLQDVEARAGPGCRPLLVLNMEVRDSHEEAAKVAPHVLRLCQMLERHEEWLDQVDAVLRELLRKHGRRVTFAVCFC